MNEMLLTVLFNEYSLHWVVRLVEETIVVNRLAGWQLPFCVNRVKINSRASSRFMFNGQRKKSVRISG